MHFELRFQDPSAADPDYLYERLITELVTEGVARFEGIFAFASRNGVSTLLRDPDFVAFLSRTGSCSILVGLDAITDRAALDLLESLAAEFPSLEVSVFHNDASDLFHPKLSRFVYEDGRTTVVVGSGNLTPGGLRRNIEAYGVTYFGAEDIESGHAALFAWDEFKRRNRHRIQPIDDRAREAAARNQRQAQQDPRGRRRDASLEEARVALEEAAAERSTELPPDLDEEQRMLLAEVPRAGSRWHQVHFNATVVEEFFRARPNSPDRVFLYEVLEDGTALEVEARKVVYSRTNANHKIEFAARRGEDYPDAGKPILVLREVATRMHRYRMLFPGDDGYSGVRTLLQALPQMGRGSHRALATPAQVRSAWPACPV